MKRRPDTTTVLRGGAVLSLVIIVVLSLVPGYERPHTGFSGNIEHFVAYAGTALLSAAALPPMRGWRSVAVLSLASALFELAQIYIPDRGPGIDNWLASTAGAMFGAALALVAARRFAAVSAGRN